MLLPAPVRFLFVPSCPLMLSLRRLLIRFRLNAPNGVITMDVAGAYVIYVLIVISVIVVVATAGIISVSDVVVVIPATGLIRCYSDHG